MVRIARNIAVIGVLGVSLALSGFVAGHPARAQTTTITIVNFAFSPATVTVPAGATVTWTNQDSVAHTVTSDTGVWDSGTLNTGASYSRTFSTPGTFPYHCTIHPFMKAQIVVQASGATATSQSNPTATSTSSAAPPAATSTPTATPQPTATAAAPPAKAHFQIKVSGSLRAGRATTLRISIANSKTHKPVGKASVALDARKVGLSKVLKVKTNGKGSATFRNVRSKRTGKATISVSKKGYATKKVTVNVSA